MAIPIIPVATVTCRAVDQQGFPIAGARFIARLNVTEIYQGFVVPETVEAIADDNGVALLKLFPNVLGKNGSLYTVQGINPHNGKRFLNALALVPNAPCELTEILVDEAPVTYDAATQILLGAREARDEAQRLLLQSDVANIIHVKSNGDDTRNGRSWHSAVKTIERALALATASSLPTLIEWAPDSVVYTEGHLDMPDNCVVKAVHRTVFLRPKPGFEQRNVFRMGSGCFLEGVMFEGWRVDSLTNPTSGFAVSFRPGAVIRRTPYAHKIAVRSIPTWDVIAPPLDRANANPEVPVGPGVALADGLVCSPYSIFPNIMTWGATPVAPNGIGYCAKNGALINAVNAVSIWAHKHFMALSGGQIILSACSTQFGDYSMAAKGFRYLIVPKTVANITVQTQATAAILAAQTALIDSTWAALSRQGYTTGWTAQHEAQTRRDTATLLQCLRWTMSTANQQPMLDFAKGLFDPAGERVLRVDMLAAFVYSFDWLATEIKKLAQVNSTAGAQVLALLNALTDTLNTPVKRKEPSRITAIGHTWTAVMAGVALTKVPPARNGASITDSILEEDEGVVIASGQDDQGNALFVGGLQINADTGELGGPPFDQAVRRVATRAAISRSF